MIASETNTAHCGAPLACPEQGPCRGQSNPCVVPYTGTLNWIAQWLVTDSTYYKGMYYIENTCITNE